MVGFNIGEFEGKRSLGKSMRICCSEDESSSQMFMHRKVSNSLCEYFLQFGRRVSNNNNLVVERFLIGREASTCQGEDHLFGQHM